MDNKYAPIVEKLRGRYSKDLLVGPPLDEEHLGRIEMQLGYCLPKDYREFLSDYGGIFFPSAEFPMLEDNQQGECSIFTFFGSAEKGTLADVYYEIQKNLEFEDEAEEFYPGIRQVRSTVEPIMGMNWPKELLPIGSDQGGNLICLALFGLRPGAMFFWRSNPFPDAQNLYLIADSFDEFMHLLYRAD